LLERLATQKLIATFNVFEKRQRLIALKRYHGDLNSSNINTCSHTAQYNIGSTYIYLYSQRRIYSLRPRNRITAECSPLRGRSLLHASLRSSTYPSQPYMLATIKSLTGCCKGIAFSKTNGLVCCPCGAWCTGDLAPSMLSWVDGASGEFTMVVEPRQSR
jgi:hypothetical protein